MNAPTRPRWTHVAIPVSDLDKAIDFYTSLTPLVVVARNEDENGRGAWLSNEGQVEDPFVLVIAEFVPDEARRFGRRSGEPQPTLAPFAHLGIEMPTKEDVDRIAERARELGALVWEPQLMAPHIGYICSAHDPDGNIVEFSFGQKVFATVRERWGQPVAGRGD